MMPETSLPEGTTKEQWQRYEMDKANHEARIRNKREFLHTVLNYIQNGHTVAEAHYHFTCEIDMAWSMDRPNEPGYYRAAND